MNKKSPRKNKPILSYRILAVPVEDDAPYAFASPKCVVDLFEKKAKQRRQTVEEHLLEVFNNDLQQAVTVTLNEIEKGHTLWKEEFEGPFRIAIEVPAEYADYLKKRLALYGTSVGEHIMNTINTALLDFELEGEPEQIV